MSEKNPKAAHKRVLLKLSGEGLMGDLSYGISASTLDALAEEIAQLHESGVQMGIVIGGGNIFRGVAGAAQGMERAVADQMGMLATIINALAFQDSLTRHHVPSRVMSALESEKVAEPFARARALRHLEKGRIIIFAAGTGNPFFTTDTAATLRALEIKAEVLLKATGVDGIYNNDPKKDRSATKFDELTYHDMLEKDLRVIDAAAISMARDGHLPIIVFNMKIPGNIKRAVLGEAIGTIVKGE